MDNKKFQEMQLGMFLTKAVTDEICEEAEKYGSWFRPRSALVVVHHIFDDGTVQLETRIRYSHSDYRSENKIIFSRVKLNHEAHAYNIINQIRNS